MARVSPSSRSLQQYLGEKIQALRRSRGLTQEALAGRCGITQKYLSELERGEKAPSWETLVALAHQGFETRLASLLYGVDDEPDREARELSDLLAGRPEQARHEVLKAVRLLLRAGERAGGGTK